MSWQRFLEFDRDDSETRELKRTREILMKKQVKTELRKEVEALKKKFGKPEPKKTAFNSDFWGKRGVQVTDRRQVK